MLKGKVKYAIQPPITLCSHAWPPTIISGVGIERIDSLLHSPIPPCMSLAAAAHFFIAELVYIILLGEPGPACTEGFHVGNNTCYFPGHKGFKARDGCTKKERKAGETREQSEEISVFVVQGQPDRHV